MAYFYYDVDEVAKRSVASMLLSEWEEFNGRKMLKFIITPGTYGPDTGFIIFTPDNTHRIHDYPYMAVSYKANSNVLRVDMSVRYTDKNGSHESWTETAYPALVSDKNINSFVYDVRKTDAVCFPETDYESCSYLIKPFGGHIGAVAKSRDFSLNYIAFFETAEEAEKFNLENTPEKIVYDDEEDAGKNDRVSSYAKKYYGNTPVTVFSGQDFIYNLCLSSRIHELGVKLCDNGSVKYFTEKKFYMSDQNVIRLSSAGMNFSPRVYSHVRVVYKTTTDKLEARIDWDKSSSGYKCLRDCGEENGYKVALFDINELTEGGISAKYGNITLCLRNADLDNKDAEEENEFEILYVAFFEKADDAVKYEYSGADKDYIKKHPMAYLPGKKCVSFIEKNDFSVADKYISDAEEQKSKIRNSINNYEESIYGTTYYVSSINGSDENDGLSPETPFKTCKRFSGMLKEYDYVLFERGSLFRECIHMRKGVTYSAYGEGEKPRFYNSIDGVGGDKWTLTDKENVWVFNTDIPGIKDIGNIIFDGGRAWGIKVLKDIHGYRKWQGDCFNGFECVNIPEVKFTDYRDMKYNLEYYHDWENSKLYLYCNFGNPGEYFKEIEMSMKGIIISGSATECVIDNLNVMYTGSHGIGTSDFSDFTVQYCEFGFIGGSIQGAKTGMTGRFGNAVECFGSCENYVIHDCYAYQVYDCCFTTQWQGTVNDDVIMNGVRFYNNVAELSNTGLETWLACHRLYASGNQYKFRNMELFNNYNMYMGYGWSHQRFNKDSNFFYGDVLISDTYYENCSVHHNVNVYTSTVATFARYTGKKGFNFHDNVYVLERDRDFVWTACTPTDGSGRLTSFRADKEGVELLSAHTVEENSVVYSVPENSCVNEVAKALYAAQGAHTYGLGNRCKSYKE